MRDKLIELIGDAPYGLRTLGQAADELISVESIADYLIANANVLDINVGKWIPVSERLPKPFVSVLVQMPGEEPCPTVREGFMTNDGDWYAGYFARLKDEVSHWMPMPKPPKEGE